MAELHRGLLKNAVKNELALFATYLATVFLKNLIAIKWHTEFTKLELNEAKVKHNGYSEVSLQTFAESYFRLLELFRCPSHTHIPCTHTYTYYLLSCLVVSPWSYNLMSVAHKLPFPWDFQQNIRVGLPFPLFKITLKLNVMHINKMYENFF